MPDLEDFIALVGKLIPGRYGSWQHPDIAYACQDGSFPGECGPVIWSAPYELRKLTVSYSRVYAPNPIQDAAMTTHHFLNLTGGDPDASWTAADYTAVESAFDTYWSTLKTYWNAEVVLSQYSWRADGPAFKPHGSELSPTLRNTPRNVPGTNGSSGMPPQLAITVTEVTDAKFIAHDVEGVGEQLRNRWGRYYLPPPAFDVSATVSHGRVHGVLAEAIATATQTMYDALTGLDLVPVMYSPTTGNAWSVREIHVDDIFDVIRSRRFVTPLSRHSKTLIEP